jgi:hypothetical protein
MVAAVTLIAAWADGDGPIGAALAEPTGYDARSSGARGAGPEAGSASARHELASVLGREVRTRVEEDVGRIIDLLADRDGRVQAAVIEFGGFLGIGTRKIAVEWSSLRFQPEGKQPPVIVELTRDQLRRAPEYKPTEPAIVRRAAD